MALSSAKLVQTLPLLAFITLLLMQANKVKSSDSLSFTFSRFEEHEPDLTYQRDANLPDNSGILRLTKTDDSGNPLTNSVGRVLYSDSVRLWSDVGAPLRVATFETTFSFRIKYSGKTLADGIAFFIIPENYSLPATAAGGNLGLFEGPPTETDPSKNQIVLVEFDTYPNSFDPNYQHIGINVNTINSSAVTEWESKSGQVVTARIDYNSATKKLSVSAQYTGEKATTLDYGINLKAYLPQWVKIGISASTGRQVAIFDVISWNWSSELVYVQGNKANKEKQDMYIAQYV